MEFDVFFSVVTTFLQTVLYFKKKHFHAESFGASEFLLAFYFNGPPHSPLSQPTFRLPNVFLTSLPFIIIGLSHVHAIKQTHKAAQTLCQCYTATSSSSVHFIQKSRDRVLNQRLFTVTKHIFLSRGCTALLLDTDNLLKSGQRDLSQFHHFHQTPPTLFTLSPNRTWSPPGLGRIIYAEKRKNVKLSWAIILKSATPKDITALDDSLIHLCFNGMNHFT